MAEDKKATKDKEPTEPFPANLRATGGAISAIKSIDKKLKEDEKPEMTEEEIAEKEATEKEVAEKDIDPKAEEGVIEEAEKQAKAEKELAKKEAKNKAEKEAEAKANKKKANKKRTKKKKAVKKAPSLIGKRIVMKMTLGTPKKCFLAGDSFVVGKDLPIESAQAWLKSGAAELIGNLPVPSEIK